MPPPAGIVAGGDHIHSALCHFFTVHDIRTVRDINFEEGSCIYKMDQSDKFLYYPSDKKSHRP